MIWRVILFWWLSVMGALAAGSFGSPLRVDGYGPVQGYQSPPLTASTAVTDTLVWRSRSQDPSGFYCLGARYYDPKAGRFLSPDPMGHAGSMDLYSFCNGDPINQFDPTGRFGKNAFEGGVAAIGDAMDFSGGPSYETMMGNGTTGFGAGYEVAHIVVEALEQAGVIMATEGLGELGEGLLAEAPEVDGLVDGAAAKGTGTPALNPVTTPGNALNDETAAAAAAKGESGAAAPAIKAAQETEAAVPAVLNQEAEVALENGGLEAASTVEAPVAAAGNVEGVAGGGGAAPAADSVPLAGTADFIGPMPAADTGAYSAIGSTGKVGEQWLAQNLGGESQVYFNTTQGGRYVDQLVGDVANESKVGYQSLTPSIQLQISKDAELLNGGTFQGVNWHFFQSPVTGLGGPSQPLLNALQQNGINVIIH